jgi:hypothetical protein
MTDHRRFGVPREGYLALMTTSPTEPHGEVPDDVTASESARGVPDDDSGFEQEEPGSGSGSGTDPDEVPEQAAGRGEPVEPPD